MKRKTITYSKREEEWNIDGDKVGHPGVRVIIRKVAVRDNGGRFHGATNFVTRRP